MTNKTNPTVKERIEEEHSQFMELQTRQIKWNQIKYKLDELFKHLPVFEIPPMHFSELSEEQKNKYEYKLWAEVYEIILADTRFSNQANDYLQLIRNRRRLDEEQARNMRNFPFLYIKKDLKQISMEERKRRLAKALKEQLEKLRQGQNGSGINEETRRSKSVRLLIKGQTNKSLFGTESSQGDPQEELNSSPPPHVKSFILKPSVFKLPIALHTQRLIKNIQSSRELRRMEFSKYKTKSGTLDLKDLATHQKNAFSMESSQLLQPSTQADSLSLRLNGDSLLSRNDQKGKFLSYLDSTVSNRSIRKNFHLQKMRIESHLRANSKYKVLQDSSIPIFNTERYQNSQNLNEMQATGNFGREEQNMTHQTFGLSHSQEASAENIRSDSEANIPQSAYLQKQAKYLGVTMKNINSLPPDQCETVTQ
ncbi:hypothetical protein FGO68_gene621 [Halteria grandinella]|uniref:Uncharacterized protein n=1 Tax=Halteria grandinella TaxID=5974 RepID=A0A8J8NRY3_HALGN|nr:hypothetical protein FGO68_gene621 [Halteria grandinella]